MVKLVSDNSTDTIKCLSYKVVINLGQCYTTLKCQLLTLYQHKWSQQSKVLYT